MSENTKIVDFEECKRCIHWEKEEQEDPCYECLNEPARYASKKPRYFEEKPTKKKGN